MYTERNNGLIGLWPCGRSHSPLATLVINWTAEEELARQGTKEVLRGPLWTFLFTAQVFRFLLDSAKELP